MTYLTIALVILNITLMVLGVAFFQPIRRVVSNLGREPESVEGDADRSAAIFKAIQEALSTHAKNLLAVDQSADRSDVTQTLADDCTDQLRQSNQATGRALNDNGRQLNSLLGRYGDLYRAERDRIESYGENLNELDELLAKFQEDSEGSNQILLQLVRDMVRENRVLQNKVSDCQEQVSELIVRSIKSEREARTDVLTQIPNRRAWDEKLVETNYPASIALIDVDDFKTINDRYGHAAGDAMLTLIGTILRNTNEVSAYRIGGDEFALLIPPTAEELITERIRKKIAAAVLQFGGERLSVSVSIGVAPNRNNEPLQSTLIRADDALFKAKAHKDDQVHTVQFA